MMIYFTKELNEYLNKKNFSIKAISLHPGVVNKELMHFYKNKLWSKINFTLFYPLFKLDTKTIKEWAQTQLYLSFLDYNELSSGVYYADCKLEKISKTVQDNNLGIEFMNYTMEKICEVIPKYDKESKNI